MPDNQNQTLRYKMSTRLLKSKPYYIKTKPELLRFGRFTRLDGHP